MWTYKVSEGLNDFSDAMSIRTAVFIEEQGFVNEFDDIDKSATHIVVYEDQAPFATGRAYPSPENKGEYIIGRVAVLKGYRGRGAGVFLMKCLEKHLSSAGVKSISLGAQTRAQEFYKKLGYESFGEGFFDEACPHIRMRKNL